MYNQDDYGSLEAYAPGHAKPLLGPPFRHGRKRINVLSGMLALFVPWLLFCGIASLWSFSIHYRSPGLTLGITVGIGVVLALLACHVVYLSFKACRGQYQLVETGDHAVWTLFILATCCVAFALALCMGRANYEQNMRGTFDVSSLSSYTGVNPATMRGQELMDAGTVSFVDGAEIDLRYANGLRNTDIYCVAPITLGNTVLASYDFWAVGKNCCSDGKDFKCGNVNARGSKGGVRIVSDADRNFYRLAVQQASSAHAIKTIHPLFFRWTTEPAEEQDELERVGFQWILKAVLGYFCFQLLLVVMALSCFSKIASD